MDSQLLDSYATVILEFGLKIKYGEKVLILFDENGIELARRISSKAYQLGASDVRTIYRDSEIEISRYQYGTNQALKSFPKFEADYQLESMRNGYHSINLMSFNGVENNIDANKIAAYQTIRSKMMAETQKIGMSNHVKWVIAPVASYRWAKAIHPQLAPDIAYELLWEELFKVCRVNEENPLLSWKIHNQSLKFHTDWLNRIDIQSLHFMDQNTDLTVGLVDNHIWCGGENVTKDGKVFLSNIPTEEVYTMPNKYEVDGHVKITRPFMLYGKLINELTLYFKEGKVIDFITSGATELISKFIHTDSGSNRLGEIALVDKFSPINQINHPFYQLLIDENACSHLALGNAYEENITNTYSSKESVGFNQSSVHLDLMIGSNDMTVTGKLKDGQEMLIMKEGTWVNFKEESYESKGNSAK